MGSIHARSAVCATILSALLIGCGQVQGPEDKSKAPPVPERPYTSWHLAAPDGPHPVGTCRGPIDIRTERHGEDAGTVTASAALIRAPFGDIRLAADPLCAEAITSVPITNGSGRFYLMARTAESTELWAEPADGAPILGVSTTLEFVPGSPVAVTVRPPALDPLDANDDETEAEPPSTIEVPVGECTGPFELAARDRWGNAVTLDEAVPGTLLFPGLSPDTGFYSDAECETPWRPTHVNAPVAFWMRSSRSTALDAPAALGFLPSAESSLAPAALPLHIRPGPLVGLQVLPGPPGTDPSTLRQCYTWTITGRDGFGNPVALPDRATVTAFAVRPNTDEDARDFRVSFSGCPQGPIATDTPSNSSDVTQVRQGSATLHTDHPLSDSGVELLVGAPKLPIPTGGATQLRYPLFSAGGMRWPTLELEPFEWPDPHWQAPAPWYYQVPLVGQAFPVDQVPAGRCTAARLIPPPGDRLPRIPANNIQLEDEASALRLFRNPDCTERLTSVGEEEFYVRAQHAGRSWFRLRRENEVSRPQPIHWVTSAPIWHSVRGPLRATAGACAGSYSAILRDEWGHIAFDADPLGPPREGDRHPLISQVCDVPIAGGFHSADGRTHDRAGTHLVFGSVAAAPLQRGVGELHIDPGPPDEPMFLTPPRRVASGECSPPIWVGLRDRHGNLSLPDAPEALRFGASGRLKFFADADCREELGEIPLDAPTPVAEIYVQGDALGFSDLRMRLSGGKTAQQSLLITSAPSAAR